jgi:hypothetical protein
MVLQMKNKYIYRSKISEAKFRQIVKLFALDLDATQISEITGIRRVAINRYLMVIRKRIAEFMDRNFQFKEKLKSMSLILAETRKRKVWAWCRSLNNRIWIRKTTRKGLYRVRSGLFKSDIYII